MKWYFQMCRRDLQSSSAQIQYGSGTPVCLSCGKSMHRLFHCFRQTVYPMYFRFGKNPTRRYNINIEMKGKVLWSVPRVAFCSHDFKLRVAQVPNFLHTMSWLVRRLWMEETVSSLPSETANTSSKRLSTWKSAMLREIPQRASDLNGIFCTI
jgi:hypothetical protein